MIRLNKTTEYSLLALRFMNSRRRQSIDTATSAREISDHFGLPFDITAKTLQRLRDTGLIQSAQGAHGGYTLKRGLDEVSLAEFLQLLEGPQSIVACASDKECGCSYKEKCEIRDFMGDLNHRVLQFLNKIHLSDLGAGSFQKVLPLGGGGTS